MTTDRTYTEAVSEFGRQMADLRGEVTNGLTELQGAVTNLTTVVEAGNAARVAEISDIKTDVKDHETRIRALEKFMWKSAGIGVVGGAGLGLLANWIIGNL